MNQKDKKVLLRDLCCRLPYNVICKDNEINCTGKLKSIHINYNMVTLYDINNDEEFSHCCIENIKPYLFPLSSMMEEQKEEFDRLYTYDALIVEPQWELIDFCNKHHLDYRGLISKGLAIDATDLNIY